MRQLLYCKMQQKFITMCVWFLLQNATAITKCNDFIAKCDSYYKMQHLLQNAMILLQNATFIKYCDSTSIQNTVRHVLRK